MAISSISSDQFSDHVLNASQPVLVDFWAPWCGPCQLMAPVLEEVEQNHPEISVVKVNIDEEPELAQRYHVASVPTVMLFEHGAVANRAVGVRPKGEIEMMIQ